MANNAGNRGDATKKKLNLYKAALSGDWEMAECNGPLTATLNEDGETALHIATAASQTHFVKMLVGKISREDLAIETIPPDPTETPNTNAARAPPLVEPMAAAATTSQIVADPNMGTGPAPVTVAAAKATATAIAAAKATATAIAAQQENDQATAIVTIVRQVEDPIQATPAVSQSEDQGQQPKENGNTAFCYAALSGNVKIAQIMMRKNDALPTKRGRQNFLPIYMAALAGQAEMVRELYNHHQANEKDKLEDDDLISLLIALVESDIYDIALKMIRERPKLATMKDKDGKTSALHAFAEKPCIPSIQTSSGIWSYCINFLLNKDKRKQGLDLVEKLWEEVISYNDDEVSRFMNVPSGRLIFIAAENGNVEFLAKLICKYPDLVLKVDDNQHTIFHKAILNRHEKIFMLIFELGMMKTLIEICEDKDGNNMLHLAGKMPQEESRVNVVPGAALQLQRELQWFEVVKKVVRPGQIAAKNVDGKTPRDVFMKEHKELREAAEKWMINTANSCMLVATLIATVVFAAAFTVPGGNGQDNGIPIFVRDTLFKIFAVADGVSLAFSTSSILSFLSILTSRFSMDDFLKSLPNKLILGLLFLFIAIITMMGAFVLAFFLIFKHRNIGFAISIAAVASLPILLFIWQIYLLIEMVRSTYLSFLLCCNKKSLFPSKSKFQRLKKLCCCFN